MFLFNRFCLIDIAPQMFATKLISAGLSERARVHQSILNSTCCTHFARPSVWLNIKVYQWHSLNANPCHSTSRYCIRNRFRKKVSKNYLHDAAIQRKCKRVFCLLKHGLTCTRIYTDTLTASENHRRIERGGVGINTEWYIWDWNQVRDQHHLIC